MLVVDGGPPLTSLPVAPKNLNGATEAIPAMGMKLPLGRHALPGVAQSFDKHVDSGTSRTWPRTLHIPGRLLLLESMTWVTA